MGFSKFRVAFLRGPAAVRRTLEHLEKDPIKLRNRVQILTLHYNKDEKTHKGMKEFAYWNLNQLQYNNPDVQILTFMNLTPAPFFRAFCDTGEDILVDVDGYDRVSIVKHLRKVLGKSGAKIAADALKKDPIQPNPAHFGWGCWRQCICTTLGQVPCPALVSLPYTYHGKYRFRPELLEDLGEEPRNFLTKEEIFGPDYKMNITKHQRPKQEY
ncbi:Ribosomal protein/NADH dehydrogenase domain [Trinorchestia longiramus]|nr:Ribosomal protein/NADH dehydrogenase domain [Trinorchestia longiramus]